MQLEGLLDHHVLSCSRCGRLAMSESALMLAQMADEEELRAAADWIDTQRAAGSRGGLNLNPVRFVGA